MRSALVLIVMLVTPAALGGTGCGGRHLFILSGQSNMAHLKPDDSFTPAVADVFGEDRVIVVKDAQSGQPIRRWYRQWEPVEGDPPDKTGELYGRLMEKVRAVVDDHEIDTVTFIWMQGERDAREGHGEVYRRSLRGLIEQLREDLDREKLYFVVGRLSDFDLQNERYPGWTEVRAAQRKVAEASPRGAWVNTDDLNDWKNKQGKEIRNALHYSKEGYRKLGRRFAEKAIALVTGRAEDACGPDEQDDPSRPPADDRAG